jgi:hypothetical protein
MTLNFERELAIKRTREFLYSLLDPKVTPKVPKSVRRTAKDLLKHYPTVLDMEVASDKCPEIFGEQNETQSNL